MTILIFRSILFFSCRLRTHLLPTSRFQGRTRTATPISFTSKKAFLFGYRLNQLLSIPLDPTSSSDHEVLLHVSVLDWNCVGEADVLGECKLPVSMVDSNVRDEWFDLRPVKPGSGSARLRLKWCNLNLEPLLEGVAAPLPRRGVTGIADSDLEVASGCFQLPSFWSLFGQCYSNSGKFRGRKGTVVPENSGRGSESQKPRSLSLRSMKTVNEPQEHSPFESESIVSVPQAGMTTGLLQVDSFKKLVAINP